MEEGLLGVVSQCAGRRAGEDHGKELVAVVFARGEEVQGRVAEGVAEGGVGVRRVFEDEKGARAEFACGEKPGVLGGGGLLGDGAPAVAGAVVLAGEVGAVAGVRGEEVSGDGVVGLWEGFEG